MLHDAEVERKLIALISQDKSTTVQQAGALALAVMAENEAARDAIRKYGTRVVRTYFSYFTRI